MFLKITIEILRVNALAHIEQAMSASPASKAPGERALVATPLYHAAGINRIFNAVVKGGTVVLMEHFEAEAFLATIERERINSCNMGPSIMQSLVHMPGIGERRFDTLKVIYYGAAPISVALMRRAMEVFHCTLVQGYGLTEATGGFVYLNEVDHARALHGADHLLRACGRPVLADVRIVDEQGRDCAVDQPGELLVFCGALPVAALEQPRLGHACAIPCDPACSFTSAAALRFTGSVVHAGTAIGFAWIGYGPVSLAWANTLSTVSGILVVWILARPNMPWKTSLRGVSEVVSFGGQLTLTSLMNTLASGAPELFLGKMQSMVEAGYFSRAQGLVSMFQRLVMDAVNAVALPYFAKQSREAHDLGSTFIVAMELVTGLAWPFFIGIAILAHPAIAIL